MSVSTLLEIIWFIYTLHPTQLGLECRLQAAVILQVLSMAVSLAPGRVLRGREEPSKHDRIFCWLVLSNWQMAPDHSMY